MTSSSGTASSTDSRCAESLHASAHHDASRPPPHRYRKFNGLAMRSLRPGGLLLSCTCSAAMTQSGGFVKMLHEAAWEQGRALTVLRVTGPAADHVIHPACPESSYLTAVLAFVL